MTEERERDRSYQLFGVLAAVIAVVLFVGVVVVVVDDEPGVPASGARATVDGEVLVVHPDGSSSTLETGDLVAAGDEVRVQSGTVVLELASGGVLEGREGPDDGDGDDAIEGTRVEIGSTPELLAGDLLARGDVPVTVGAGGNEVSLVPGDGEGAVKIRRGLSVTVGSYVGAARLDSAGQERAVPTYRQLSVATIGRPPASPDPLRLDAADRWDLRYLGVAFELTRRLDSLAGTYSSNVADGAKIEKLVAILPELAREQDFGPELLVDERNATRPGGELLVGLSIALLGREGDFGERYTSVREFRDDGAEWGLVALDQGVDDGDLVDTVEAAFGRAVEPALEVAGVPPPNGSTTPTTVAGGSPDTSPSSSPPDEDGSDTTSPPTTTPPPTVPPTTLPPILTLPTLPPPPGDDGGGDVLPDTGVDPIDDIVEPLDDLLAGILGG